MPVGVAVTVTLPPAWGDDGETVHVPAAALATGAVNTSMPAVTANAEATAATLLVTNLITSEPFTRSAYRSRPMQAMPPAVTLAVIASAATTTPTPLDAMHSPLNVATFRRGRGRQSYTVDGLLHGPGIAGARDLRSRQYRSDQTDRVPRVSPPAIIAPTRCVSTRADGTSRGPRCPQGSP